MDSSTDPFELRPYTGPIRSMAQSALNWGKERENSGNGGDAEWAFFETIARNLAYNKIRSQKTAKRGAKTVSIDDPGLNHDPAAPDEPDYAERQHDALRKQQLRDAITALTSGQRECIQLRLDEFTYEEIAKILRVSVDAVKSRLRDAKKILRERLGDGDGLPEDES